ncbi:hypothetical protein LB505_005815 [Fusarium chuoi]|nr:hypothetical protein LB505_005815 [Fusarium chuoi]
MSSKQYILLQNATLLVPKGAEDDHVIQLKNHSLLIEGNKIARIALHIDPPSESTEVIDCSAKIISPGFVDTHHHLGGSLGNYLIWYQVYLLLLPYRNGQDLEAVRNGGGINSSLAFPAVNFTV